MERYKRKIFDIIQLGNKDNLISRAFDGFIVMVIFINLIITVLQTFEEMKVCAAFFDVIELITIIIFAIEYVLRVWTATYLYPHEKISVARIKFIFSFYGLVDFFTFFPYFLPFFFPAGIVAFRMFRVIRIFRLFKINSQYDAFNVITGVLKEKKNQLVSSVCMILILMVASSLFMYSLEHEAQPENFKNAFSGIWWSVSTLLTVGYGDIYPVTFWGKFAATVISFLGVGMVAIPTGIISAGFVEQYSKLKISGSVEEEKEYHFVTSYIGEGHSWHNKMVREIVFPPQLILVMIIRDGKTIVPKGDTLLKYKDTLVIGAKHFKDEYKINLKEIVIKEESPWIGKMISEIDISQLELIVMIQRKNRILIPNGSTTIKNGDILVMYSKR